MGLEFVKIAAQKRLLGRPDADVQPGVSERKGRI
jgi:hypothetical protein